MGLIGVDKSRLKELAMMIRSSLIEEWYGNEKFHKLSLILKSLGTLDIILNDQ